MTDTSTHKVLGRRYELLRRMSSDGARDVFLAHDQATDQVVATTVLFPRSAADPSLVARFQSQLQTAAGLNHPNVVRVVDWGSHDDSLFLVKEYVEGTTLTEVLSTNGPLPAYRAARVAAEVASALAAAHRRGITHNSLTPATIIVASSGQVKVADFGVAPAGAGDDDRPFQFDYVPQTTASTVANQSQTTGVDPGRDLYSLGLVLLEMVTADQPLAPASTWSITDTPFLEDSTSQSAANPIVPAGLGSIIDRLVTTDPTLCYPSAEAVEADLRRFGDGLAGPDPTRVAPRGSKSGLLIGSPTGATEVVKVRPSRPRQGRFGFVAAIRNATNPRSSHTDGQQAEATAEDFDDPVSSPLFLVTVAGLLLLLVVLVLYISIAISGPSQDHAGDPVSVPTVIGDTQAVATDRLVDAGFIVDELFVENDEFESGTVFAQDPRARAEIEVGDRVTISIAQAPETAVVPDVIGKTHTEASDELSALGFTVHIQRQTSDVVEIDQVIDQSVHGGQEVDKGSDITLVVSSGPEQGAVPDLAGLAIAEATLELGQFGFQTVRLEFEPSADVARDNVIQTEPPPGSQIELTVPIIVFVSTADHDLVPFVLGLALADAEQLLSGYGFGSDIEFVEVDADSGQVGIVVSQRPEDDALVPIGTNITLQVGREPDRRFPFLSWWRDRGRGDKQSDG